MLKVEATHAHARAEYIWHLAHTSVGGGALERTFAWDFFRVVGKESLAVYI